MQVTNSYELFEKLFALDLLEDSPPYWWPEYGQFEVILGAILTQNTRFDKVELSLHNLRNQSLLTLEAWIDLSPEAIMESITPSGLYRQKSQRLIALTQAMIETYGTYESFVDQVDRDWLLSQKGIGLETADAILCYACQRAIMVVDSYTARLLGALGFEFESYEDIQAWLTQGIEQAMEKISVLYGQSLGLETIYAHFHGMIVEYCKRYSSGKQIDISLLD